jgi:DMSO/TMAO reductase YedYZ heme-binding membrane subunit
MTFTELLNCFLLAIGFLCFIGVMTLFIVTSPKQPNEKGGAVWGTKEK